LRDEICKQLTGLKHASSCKNYEFIATRPPQLDLDDEVKSTEKKKGGPGDNAISTRGAVTLRETNEKHAAQLGMINHEFAGTSAALTANLRQLLEGHQVSLSIKISLWVIFWKRATINGSFAERVLKLFEGHQV